MMGELKAQVMASSTRQTVSTMENWMKMMDFQSHQLYWWAKKRWRRMAAFS
jgi:hypothetical protein